MNRLTCLIFWLFSNAAAAQVSRFEFTHPQMGTTFRLVFYAPDSAGAARLARTCFDRVDTLNAIMSDYLPESELNRLCARAGERERLAISRDLYDIFKWANRVSRQSGGAFDVTVGPLTRLWRRARKKGELPDSAQVAAAQNLVDWRQIQLCRRRSAVRLSRKGVQIDLGGIAQGYAADACLEILRKNGCPQALADAGGDLALGEAPPGAAGWQIEIPDSAGQHRVLWLQRCGITTSGAQYRFLELGGVRYSHIVDPRTGWPLTHRVLVTVQGPSAVEADAWATALSVAGQAGWHKLGQKQRKLRVWMNEMRL